jgi:hypothetical protein
MYLLLRQHISALTLGHHQVSNCISEETIQCSKHTHLTHRVYTLNIAYDLDFIILASLTIINGHSVNEISLDDMSYVNTTLYSPL